MAGSAEQAEDQSTVVIVGAGPAGLVLGNLLLAEGIDCLILERGTREHVQTRARAGFLVANSVRILEQNGLANGLLHKGQTHDVCAFRTGQGHFELCYGDLGLREQHTVYPQQFLVTDLVAEFLCRGGDLRFGTTVTEIADLHTDRPVVTYRDADGTVHRASGRFVAGCDGNNGASRQSVAAHAATRHRRDHGIAWLALLIDAPQSMCAVTYAIHEDGFAGHMARSPSVTRYYLQCPPEDNPETWSDQRVWDALNRRMRTAEFGPLHEGPISERRVVHLRSDVIDPIQHGRLFLAGDAASLISPSAAKGANLAIAESDILAKAMIAAVRKGDEQPLVEYSMTCLPRIWKAQEFSHYMIQLLHGPSGDHQDARFLRELQRARLENLRGSRTHQDFFAEHYVGI